MRRAVLVTTADEGQLFDAERACAEGLYEELVVAIGGREVRLIGPQVTQLIHMLELGVNVCPGEKQKLVLEVEYHYDYGRP